MATLPAGLNIIKAEEVQPDRGRWLIHGPQGAGKTSLAATIGRACKTLFIDMLGEKGTRAFAGATYAQNIDVVRPKSITELDDLYNWLADEDHGYEAVVVDSLTSAQNLALRFLMGHDETTVREIRRGTMPASQQTWGQSLNIMVDLVTYFYGLADGDRAHPLHVVMTAQTKVLENEENGIISRSPDVQKGALSATMATPDYVLYCDMEPNPDYDGEEGGGSPSRHIVRFGSHPSYRTKARIPVNMRGKIPAILGRGSTAPDLTTLSQVLGIGGVPSATKTTAAATAADGTAKKEK